MMRERIGKVARESLPLVLGVRLIKDGQVPRGVANIIYGDILGGGIALYMGLAVEVKGWGDEMLALVFYGSAKAILSFLADDIDHMRVNRPK
ncbi:hypothetical protein A2972_00125 [Candidatus Amesbacteria bacterium RIFCSPLOWO2_01_FULL_47_33]|nr:MAG: hypothetical protein A2972_00125 [Candidatus Amesbacteria bacterium RIFCSPLOWO2_01_FULL_47_33]